VGYVAIEREISLPDSRFFYWPKSIYSRAFDIATRGQWAGMRVKDQGKLAFLFAEFKEIFDYLAENGISQTLTQLRHLGIRFHDFNGSNLRVILVHNEDWATPSDMAAVSQLLSGYWVVSSRTSDIYAPSAEFCHGTNNGNGYWFLRDLVRGMERFRCGFCGKKHQKVPYPAVFQAWRLEGLRLISDPVEVFGGSDCQSIAREKQRESYCIAREQLEQTKEQLKCLSKGRKQLREIRKLLRPQSSTASRPASRSRRVALKPERISLN